MHKFEPVISEIGLKKQAFIPLLPIASAVLPLAGRLAGKVAGTVVDGMLLGYGINKVNQWMDKDKNKQTTVSDKPITATPKTAEEQIQRSVDPSKYMQAGGPMMYQNYSQNQNQQPIQNNVDPKYLQA